MTPSKARIRVDVGPAALAFERTVMFTAADRIHGLVVDAQDVGRDLPRVSVVHEAGDDLEIELPRPTISGRFLKMPRDQVLAEPHGLKGCVRLTLLLLASVALATVVFSVAYALTCNDVECPRSRPQRRPAVHGSCIKSGRTS
jgi:hypothetical protein